MPGAGIAEGFGRIELCAHAINDLVYSKEFQSLDTTPWGLIHDVVHGDSQVRSSGLNQLCARYREPVYRHIRRQAIDEAEAEDLTQSFFLYVIEEDFFSRPSPMHGRFRTFLIQAITWHISKARRLNKAIKRGSQVRIVPLQDHHVAVSEDTPSPVEYVDFNRDWAQHLLAIVFEELKISYEALGKAEVFDVLKAFLTMTSATPSHAEAAMQLGMSEATVRVAISRLRNRFRGLIREEISRTVTSSEQVDDEIRILISHLVNQ